MTDRLQFVHHDHLFANREEALQYIKEYATTVGHPALYAEPIVARYKRSDCNDEEDLGPNIILGIGSMGDGTENANNRVYIIDLTATEEEIADLDERLEAAIRALTLIPLESNSLRMFSEKTEDGTLVSGDVKVAESHGYDGDVKENSLRLYSDGLFINIGLTFDKETGIIRFNVNDELTKFTIPILREGRYDVATSSIILTYTDGSVKTIDMSALQDMWYVEKNPDSPIVLKRTKQEDGRYLLSADVRIASSGLVTDNILRVTDDNRYMFVEGKASNIAYWKNGKKTNVQAAIDAIDTKVSTDTKNIIHKAKDGGIFAAARLDYNPATNTITLITSSHDGTPIEYNYTLNGMQILDDVSYDSSTQSIVMRFITSTGDYRTLKIPMSDVINEWTTLSEAHNVYLHKQPVVAGRDILTADVKLSEDPFNILVDQDHTLLVVGLASNIKYSADGEATVKDKIDECLHDIDVLSSATYFEVADTDTVHLNKATDDAEHTLTAEVKISDTFPDNILWKDEKGLYVRWDYDYSANCVTVSNGSDTKVYPLANSATLVKSAIWNDETEELILTYNDGGELKLPIGNIASEWEYNNEGHTVAFARDRHVPGHSMMTADVNISNLPDNMLTTFEENTGGKALYVSSSGVTKNANDIAGLQQQTTALDERLTTAEDSIVELRNGQQFISGTVDTVWSNLVNVSGKTDQNTTDIADLKEHHREDIDALSAAIDTEKIERISADTAIQNVIDNIKESVDNAVEQVEKNTEDVAQLSADVQTERVERISADTALQVAVDTISGNLETTSAMAEQAVQDVAEIKSGLTQERTERISADTALQNSINSVSGTLETVSAFTVQNTNNIAELNSKLEQEKVERTSADTAIYNTIESQVTELESKMNTEKTERTSADTAIQNAIDTISGNLTTTSAQTEQNKTDIHDLTVQHHMDMDAISGLINTEKTERISADTALQSAIDGISSSVDSVTAQTAQNTQDIANLSEQLAQEKVDRASADTAIYTTISNEVSGLTNQVNQEKVERISADTAIQTEVDTISSNLETTNQQVEKNKSDIEALSGAHHADYDILVAAISQEKNDRQSGDTALQTNIDNETTAREYNDNVLSHRMDDLEDRVGEAQSKADRNESAITELSGKVDDNYDELRVELTAEETQRLSADTELAHQIDGLKNLVDAVSAKTDAQETTFDDTTTIDLNRDANGVVTGRVKISNGDHNIIKSDNEFEGIYASVDLAYDSATNVLKFEASDGTDKEFQLNGGALLDSIYYDHDAEELVVVYHKATDPTGDPIEVRVPVRSLFNEWHVENATNNAALELTKVKGEQGEEDILSGRVLINEVEEDNLARISNNGIYVSGGEVREIVRDEIREPLEELQAELDNTQEGAGLGIDGSYQPNSLAHYVSAATSLNNADLILDKQLFDVSEIVDGITGGSETATTVMRFDDVIKKMVTDVKLSHSPSGASSDDDLVIDGTHDSDFVGKNALRIVNAVNTQSDEDKINGLFLSNIWDCGSYDDYDD